MDCICSLAHHDAKLRKRNPDYPMLTDEERRRNPPRRVPLSLKHPETGKRAIYGINSSTCFVIAQNQVPGLRGWEFSICFDLDRVGLVSGRKNVLVLVLFEKSSIHVNLSNTIFWVCNDIVKYIMLYKLYIAQSYGGCYIELYWNPQEDPYQLINESSWKLIWKLWHPKK